MTRVCARGVHARWSRANAKSPLWLMVACLAAGAAFTACDDREIEREDGGTGHIGHLPPEECPSDLPAFHAGEDDGLTVTGQNDLARARLIEASAVPVQPNRNDWTIAISDLEGAPLSDAAIVSACVHMPDHPHLDIPEAVVALDAPGRFRIEHINLNMSGYWEVELAVFAPSLPDGPGAVTRCGGDEGDDLLVFGVCLPR